MNETPHTHAETPTRTRPVQVPVKQLPEQLWDIVVAGAGPSGSITAQRLASEGHSVCLIDREHIPREKVCGDCLLSDAVRAIDRAGFLDEIESRGHRLETATVYSPARYHFDVPGTYITLKRRSLDTVLAYGAARAGAVLAEGEVGGIAEEREDSLRLRLTESSATLSCRYLVVATGAQIELGQRLGLVTREQPSAVAVRRYVRSGFQLEKMILSYDRSLVPGYAWIIPMGDGEYNVGCGTTVHGQSHAYGGLKRTLEVFLKEFPLGRELMAKATAQSRLGGAGLRCGLTGAQPIRHRVLGVGETVGTTFPFTGEGIGKAMETGEIAAAVLHEALADKDPGHLKEYENRLESEIRPRYHGYDFAEKWLSNPRINDLVSRRLQKSPYLRQRFEGFMAETDDPRQVFSVGTIFLSLFK